MKFNKALLWLSFMGASLHGCQIMTSVNQHIPFVSKQTSIVHGTPVEMICLWEAAEGNGLSNLPARGFAGQVLFFDQRGEEPVEVHGDVEIFVFDDLGTEEDQSKPIYKYEFEKEVFQAFKTDTNLGIAYQLFLPYPKKVAYEANCSLRVRVTPDSGRAIYSKMAEVLLPGTQPPVHLIANKSTTNRIEQTSFEQPATQKSSTAEDAAAYFGTASLPKATPNLNAEKQRLKSALSKVVHQAQPESAQAPLDLTESTTHPAQTSRPKRSNVHPLLLE